MSKISWLAHGERPEVIETFRKIHASKEFTREAAHKAFAGAGCNSFTDANAMRRSFVLTYDDLLAAQVAAEDAILAQGAEVWSIADPEAMTVTLHLEPKMDRGGI